MKIKAKSLLFVFTPLIVGCSSARLSSLVLPDGSTVTPYFAKTPGYSGPDLTVLQTYRCLKIGENDGKAVYGECSMNADYSAGYTGLVEAASVGAVGALFEASGQVGAADRLRRTKPTRINTNETTTISGVSASNASSDQNQSQQQQEQQEQSQKMKQKALGGNSTANGGGQATANGGNIQGVRNYRPKPKISLPPANPKDPIPTPVVTNDPVVPPPPPKLNGWD